MAGIFNELLHEWFVKFFFQDAKLALVRYSDVLPLALASDLEKIASKRLPAPFLAIVTRDHARRFLQTTFLAMYLRSDPSDKSDHHHFQTPFHESKPVIESLLMQDRFDVSKRNWSK